jgi:AcrR family transcriptional regulator
MTATIPSRPSNVVRRATADARDAGYREKLLTVGARLFAQKGFPQVSVEQLVRSAGVSRATFYGWFENKSELAGAIIAPVFETGLTAFRKLARSSPNAAATRLIDIYLDLWQRYRDALILSINLDRASFSYVKEQHDAFNAELRKVLEHIHSAGLLRAGDVDLALGVIARTAVPLLRVFEDSESADRLYRESMLALLVKA